VWLSLLLNRYVLGLIGVIALTAAGYFAWQHYVAAPYRAQGRAEVQPLIDQQAKQLDSDKAAFDDIAKYMLAIKANADRIRASIAAAKKANADRSASEATRVAAIEAILPAGATECERTEDAITRMLR